MAIIGIDLGTTNSLVSYWKDGKIQLLKGSDGKNMFSSAVHFMNDGILVGNEAKDKLYSDSEHTVASFKCFMGSEKTYNITGREYTPAVLSSMVLKLLKDHVEAELGEEVEEAIITVPAYFNDCQRNDTKKAAQLAGLKVERLINEPSAAALYYMYHKYGNRIDQMEDLNLLVFDFGGGTLDLSYVECFENIVEIVAVAGNNHLGGDDIDRCIMDYLSKEKGMKQSGSLLKEIRKAKEELSTDSVMEVGGMTITQDQLFEICLPLFQKIKAVVIRVLEDAGIPISEVDDFILVGGSSNLSIVQRFLKELTGKTPFKLNDCDEVVALGAGLYAGIRARQEGIQDIIMTDVCPFTLGTDCVHDKEDKRAYLLPVIKRNSTLPCTVTKRLYTVCDFQTALQVGIYQGEEYYAEENLSLGKISINVNPKPAGEAYADVSFTYDINGILNVHVKNEDGVQKNMLIRNKTLSDYEIAHYQQEMEKILSVTSPYSCEDMDRIRNELEHIYAECTESDRYAVGNAISYFERILESGRVKRIRKAYEEMNSFITAYKQKEDIKENYIFDLRNMLEEEVDDE